MITLTLLAIGFLYCTAHLAGRTPETLPGLVARLLASRGVVVAVFAATFAVMWYSWASSHPMPVVHDEMAYVLQAQIFAGGDWALPSPPLPEFWEQPYVLLQPAVAAKYFPGHALVLALGALVGWMALMPLVLQSTAGALLFVLARRVAEGGVAFLAWMLWLFTPMTLYFGPSYYSEATTVVCWLAGWYALLRWRSARATSWLLVVAVCVAWGALTRPLTGLAYAIPVGVVVGRDVFATRRWRDLLLAATLGVAVLALIPLWSARTTGDWRVTPLALYTREFMPFDLPGFGLHGPPPSHLLTPEMARLDDALRVAHAHHFPSTLPAALVSRARYLWESIWGVSSGVLSVFAVLGLLTLRGETAFAVGSGVWLLLLYLLFATPAKWTLYYYESVPAFAYLTAAGLAWAASLVGRPRGVPPSSRFNWRAPRYTRALASSALAFALPGIVALRLIHLQHITERRDLSRFAALVASLPGDKAVMFVRYAPDHDAHVTFVRNSAHPQRERIWVVYDRGDVENAHFLDLSPDRTAYLFDESLGRTYAYDPHSPP